MAKNGKKWQKKFPPKSPFLETWNPPGFNVRFRVLKKAWDPRVLGYPGWTPYYLAILLTRFLLDQRGGKIHFKIFVISEIDFFSNGADCWWYGSLVDEGMTRVVRFCLLPVFGSVRFLFYRSRVGPTLFLPVRSFLNNSNAEWGASRHTFYNCTVAQWCWASLVLNQRTKNTKCSRQLKKWSAAN